MEFVWDPIKAKANWKKHKVPFEIAALVFKDGFAIDEFDDHPDEERWCRLGMVEGRILSVIYTMRGGQTRLISARLATRQEKDRYYAER